MRNLTNGLGFSLPSAELFVSLPLLSDSCIRKSRWMRFLMQKCEQYPLLVVLHDEEPSFLLPETHTKAPGNHVLDFPCEEKKGKSDPWVRFLVKECACFI